MTGNSEARAKPCLQRIEDNRTFWMVPRSVLNPTLTPFEHQRALIAYSIIFNGKLLISDSDLINNPYLRSVLKNNDAFLREIFECKLIAIAVRSNNDQFVALSESSQQIGKREGGLLESVVGGPSPEFEFYENKALLYKYELSKAEPDYEHEVLRVFQNVVPSQGMLEENILQAVIAACKGSVARGQRLRWSSFSAGSSLWSRIDEHLANFTLTTEHKKLISDIARGPYATYLPRFFDIGATYSSEDSLGVGLWRGRNLTSPNEMQTQTVGIPTIGLSEMVAGLALLSAHDLHQLMISEVRTLYEKACAGFDPGTGSIDDVVKPYLEFRAIVNSKILSALNHRTVDQVVPSSYSISLQKPTSVTDRLSDIVLRAGIVAEEEYRELVIFSERMLADLVTAGVYSGVEYVVGRVRARYSKEGASKVQKGKTPSAPVDQKIAEELAAIHLGRDDPSIIEGRLELQQRSRDLFANVVNRQKI